MTNLEPCSFCGGEAHIGIYYDFYRVGCSTKRCQAELPQIFNSGSTDNNWYGSVSEAKKAWNTRYKRTCKMQRIKRDKYADEYECQSCYGHTWTPFGAKPEYCCHCGSEVVDGD